MPIGKRGGANPGERRGGRKKGTPNGATARKQMAAMRGIVAAERMRRSPLETILAVVEGGAEAEKITERQVAAAVAAAPYCHARLAAVAYVPPPDDTQDRRREMLRRLTYQQRKAIEEILATALATEDDGPEIEGEPDEPAAR
jgi:hypothetical protein